MIPNGPGRFPVKIKTMEKKTITLKSGKIVELTINILDDGAVDVKTDIDVTEEEAEEIASNI